MTSSVALREFRTGPLYFFDQPTGRSQIKGTRSNILLFAMSQEETQPEDSLSNAENEQEEGKSDELTDGLSDETCEDSKPDTSSALGAALNIKEHDPTDEYKRAAPHLLNELAALLSQHRWTEKGCVPHGIVNVLNYSWQDLTAGAVWKSPDQTENQERSKGSLRFDETNRPVSASDKKETRRRNSCVAGNVGLSERKPQSSSNPRVKKRKQNPPKAHNSIMASFSISSNSCNDPGWIIQTQPPSYNEPQQINLCQWVVKRLQVARTPEKLQAAGQNQSKTLILRHYGDAKAKPKDRRAWRKANPTTLVNGIPQIPEVKQQDPAQQKLHYRINDGSSFIYYPSGCMAVCHSHSGLPCGGFYTNVFSDSTCPTILATITAFGHGAVSHPPSSSRSAIAAVWDQNGGFICDHLGNITKEWHWQTTSTPREKIIIQLSDLISVRLLSGTSAMLIFRCNNERVQLPLSALSDINQSEMPYLKSDGRFTSNAALELLLVRKSKRNMTLTPVSGCSQKVLQMVRAVEGLEELSARWRRGGPGDRELKRLQQRVRETLDDWLDYYRAAIGIKCPDMERKPDVPLRTRVRREVQSATLPSLNQPQWADVKTVQSENGSNELQELQRQPSAPAERPPDSSIRLPRSTFHESKQGQAAAPSQKWTVTWTPYKQAKEEPCVTQVGPLQIHGNIKPESVVIAKSPESQPSTANCCPAPLLFTPSIPLTVCPVLLRSALLREGGQRRCCCSATLMPVVTDLEYDALVMGHPPHSQQILVVCVTLLHQPDHGTLEQLYRRRNKHRTMPCTQCQMDAFRMVRYEISTVESGCGVQNILLQQRHRAAPGMILMYIRGKLLFVGYICSDHSFSARDLQKQISRTRRDYRLGLDLPPDYKFSDTVNIADRCKQLTYKEADIIYSASVEKPEKEPKESLRLLQNNRGTFSSDQKQKDSSCHTLKVFHGIKSL